MKNLKIKMVKVKEEQKELETNLIKFNAFVKEKQLKVERGIKTEREERDLRNQMTTDIEYKEKTLVELTHAREFLEKTCLRRKMFHDFLSTVVENEASRGR